MFKTTFRIVSKIIISAKYIKLFYNIKMHIQCLIHVTDFSKIYNMSQHLHKFITQYIIFLRRSHEYNEDGGKKSYIEGKQNLLKDHWSRTVDRLSEV